MDVTELKTAIVHEWFVDYSGSERVVKNMLDVCPQADLFSMVDHLPDEYRKIFHNKKIGTSFIQRLPFSKKRFRNYLPLFPMAVEQFDLREYDLILTSSHNVAKGVITTHDQLHICYCHSPIRYAWDFYQFYLNDTVKSNFKRFILRFVMHYLRGWDFNAAQRVDHFLANSRCVANRIEKNYQRKATVLYPPVDTNSFYISKYPEDYYISVSRLVPYKRLDIIVEAFNMMPDKKLIIIGEGTELPRLKKKAGKNTNIEFLNFVPDEALKEYMSKAKAFIFAAEEDFGIVPVEAQASGLPVIAYGKGGVTETVIEKETGLFYHKLSPLELCEKVKEFEKIEDTFSREKIKEHSNIFSKEIFTSSLADYIEKCKVAKSNLIDMRHFSGPANSINKAQMKNLKKSS